MRSFAHGAPQRRFRPIWMAIVALLVATPASATLLSPSELDAQIQQCVADINADSLFSYIQQLQDFTTRNSGSDTTSTTTGIGAARRWVFDKFVEFADQGGNITASYFDFTTELANVNRLHRNPVGEILGTVTGPDKRIYLIGGHLDSRNEDVNDILGSAYGADDSASSIACLVEAARVMSTRTWNMTYRFVGFVGEEQGLVGSEFQSFDLAARGEPIAAMLNNDTMASIIGAPHPDSTVFSDTTLVRAFSTGPEQSPHRNFARYVKAMAEAYVPIQNVVLIPAEDRPSRGGDHISFANEGFTSMRFMEYLEEVDRQHTSMGDTLGAHLGMEYLRRNAQVDIASLANLGAAPATPTGLVVGDIGDSTGFRLVWPSTNTEPNLEGYIVTARIPGSLDYDQVFEIGMVNEYEFASAANESVFFGLSLRNTDDHRALVGEEILGILSSLPSVPTGLVVTSAATELQLDWNQNAEADLDGYHVYRSETSGSGYVQLTATPLMSPTYTDGAVVAQVRYYYVVTALDTSANETAFSDEDDGRLLTLNGGLLLVDETRNGNNAWIPTDAGADSVYMNMLDNIGMAIPPRGGAFYDVWDWDTDGPPDLSDLGLYSSVLWVGDDYNRKFEGFPGVSAFLREAQDVVAEYMDLGGNVMTVGWEPGRGMGFPDDPPYTLGPGDFLYDYFGVATWDRVLAPTFTGGVGQGPFPDVALEPTRLRGSWGGKLVRGEFGTLRPGTEVAYHFNSTDADSAYHLQPCATYRDNGTNKTVFWGFPLYHLQTEDGTGALTAALQFFGEISTGVPTLQASPGVFQLGRGRPNPFNHRTEIDFSVPGESAHLELSIYDVAGRRVVTLVNGPMPGGRHTAEWDGRNTRGRTVAAGVYFVRLKGEVKGGRDVQLDRKVVLLR